MRYTTTVVVGAGHCGLAMSRCLAERSVDHVVLERAAVANAWRTQRWDSLRLLTPNWMTRLPGFAYRGDDPDGYLGAPEVVRLLEDYAAKCAAPVLTDTTVTAVQPDGHGYVVRTDRGSWRARTVVVATGATEVAAVPTRLCEQVPAVVTAMTALDYRNPDQLPGGGVLVVGASASGIQIADELRRSGRPVTLAVGEHVRMPRTYRGRDVLWWMDASGLLDERYDDVPDLVRARNLPSMQLIGSPQRATVDLNTLRRLGVRVVGRFAGVRDGMAQFSGSLANVCALADLKLGRLLDSIDAWADGAGVDAEWPERFAPTAPTATVPLSMRLNEIETIVWATGFRPNVSWLQAGVFDRKGRIVHDGGVTASPGLYLMGWPFLRRRKSTLIDGAAADARELADHLVAADLAAAVARRDLPQLSAALTETVRLRALLPGGPAEVHGRDDVAARFRGWFAGFDTVEVVESAGEAVADRLLIHYRLHLSEAATRWVCTQTAICKVVDGRLAVIDLLCSGFREIENADTHAPTGT